MHSKRSRRKRRRQDECTSDSEWGSSSSITDTRRKDYRPRTPDSVPFSDPSMNANPLNDSMADIFGSPQQYPRDNDDLTLAFVNRHDSAKQLFRIWSSNITKRSISDTSLVVLEQSFGM